MNENRSLNNGIVVLGMHRGGTSLVAQLVKLWGAYADLSALLQGDQFNPRGYWEPVPLVALNDELLEAVQSRWSVPPDSSAAPVLTAMGCQGSFRDRALELLAPLSEAKQPWFWKDPRLSVLLPFWKQLWGKVRYIVAVRDPGDIADSLTNRDGMSARVSFLLWHKYMSDILAAEDVHATAIFVGYENLLTNPRKESERLCSFLDQEFGINCPAPNHRLKNMTAAVDTKLWRSHGRAWEYAPYASDIQVRLHEYLVRRSRGEQTVCLERFPLPPFWRELLSREESRRHQTVAKTSLRVYWRTPNASYAETNSASVPASMDGIPQSFELAIPRVDNGGIVGVRVDFSEDSAVLLLSALEVKDFARNVIWKWDGLAASIAALSSNDIAVCTPLDGGTGCILRLAGRDPWVEIALSSEQTKATLEGVVVVVRCTYASPFEYALFNATDHIIFRVQQLETEQAALRQDVMARIQQFEADQAGFRGEISRVRELETEQIHIKGELVSRLETQQAHLEIGQAALRHDLMDRIQQVESKGELASRMKRLEAQQSHTDRALRELLDSRIWRALVAGGGAILRLGAFSRNSVSQPVAEGKGRSQRDN